MNFSRFECDISGNRVEIPQAAYINESGNFIVCDSSYGAPVGYVEATDAQIEEHRAPKKTTEQLREEWKQNRAELVAEIKVTTSAGNTFDGDEESQGRMARAILGLQTVPGGTVNWVLADNSVIDASAAELTEALALSGSAQASIWVAN
jgi:hypothetical protein